MNRIQTIMVGVVLALLLMAGSYSPGLVTDIKNGKLFRVFSDGNDKAVTVSHDDTHGDISCDGDLKLVPAGSDVNVTGNITGTGWLDLTKGVTTDKTIYMAELAAGEGNVAAFGQLWVKNTSPNELWFTDDTGVDCQLGLAATSNRRGTVWHNESTVTVGNPINVTIQNSHAYNVYHAQSAAATGDTWTTGMLLTAGTYTIKILGVTSNGGGQLDMTVGGETAFTNEEFYSGSTAFNVIFTSASVVLPTSGWQTIQGSTDSQHVSSTGYKIIWTKMWAYQASD